MVEMATLSLFLILPCLFIWVIHAHVKNPTGAALGTWLMLTIIGVSSTLVSLFLDIGVGHGGPAPALLPVLVGSATLVLPVVGAFMMKQSKENPVSDTEEPASAAATSDAPPQDDGNAGQKVTKEDEVE
jgi:hypothetical protein